MKIWVTACCSWDSIESQSVLNKLFKTQDLQWFLQKKFTKEKHLKMSI